MSRAGTFIACVILGGHTPRYLRRRLLVNGDRGVPASLAVVAVLAFGICVRIRCAIVLLAASASATPTTPVTSASTLRLFASVFAADQTTVRGADVQRLKRSRRSRARLKALGQR